MARKHIICLVVLLEFLLLIQSSLGSTNCGNFMDCFACTKELSCRWCTLDRSCYGTESVLNSCKSSEYTTNSTQCYDKTFGQYNANSAYVNTILSAVAYSMNPQICVDKILSYAGIKLNESIGRECENVTPFSYKYCFAYTAVSKPLKLIIVAFKGTDGFKQLFDELVSNLIKDTASFKAGGKVEHYFYTVFSLMYGCVKASTMNLLYDYPDFDVVVTGHSLGGAVASLTAAALVNDNVVGTDKLSLYTFGMPRVGDSTFTSRHEQLVQNSWRVVHFNDVVVQVPGNNYHHGTVVYYNNTNMDVNSPYRICFDPEDSDCKYKYSISYKLCYITTNCITNHRNYFGIPEGSFCDKGKTGKRSVVEDAKFWTEFKNDTCMRIPFNETYTTNQSINMGSAIVLEPYIKKFFMISCMIYLINWLF